LIQAGNTDTGKGIAGRVWGSSNRIEKLGSIWLLWPCTYFKICWLLFRKGANCKNSSFL